jgi:hypothetical protein
MCFFFRFSYLSHTHTRNTLTPLCLSHRRFAAIIRNLHVEEIDPGAKSENAAKTKKDPFWRIHWIEDFLNHLWKKIYVFGDFMSMDEFTIASKIRHILLMYCKNKPHKFGFKLYMTSCPSTGFCGHFQIHNGQQNTVLKMVRSLSSHLCVLFLVHHTHKHIIHMFLFFLFFFYFPSHKKHHSGTSCHSRRINKRRAHRYL